MARVKLDENVADLVRDVLQAAGHDVALARDEQLAGVDDERLLAVAVSEGRAQLPSVASGSPMTRGQVGGCFCAEDGTDLPRKDARAALFSLSGYDSY